VKLSLPLKLGIFVVLLFGAVTAACLLWTPLRIRYFATKLKSDNPVERITALEFLLEKKNKGKETLENELAGGREEAAFLSENWKHWDKTIPDDVFNQFPLHIAAEKNYADAAGFLIDKGADVNASDRFKMTPLHWASWEDNREVVSLLLEKGADVNVTDDEDMTPLHRASEEGHKYAVKLLLGKNADVNGGNKGWVTPLRWAVYRGHKEVIILLLNNGADVNENDFSIGTLLDWAVHNERRETAALLRKYGGKTAEEIKGDADFIDKDLPKLRIVRISLKNSKAKKLSDQSVIISWEYYDKNSSPKPVTIEYSTDGGASWKTIVKGLPKIGFYEWKPEWKRVSMKLFGVRVKAVDLAGNKCYDVDWVRDAELKGKNK
jgi:ankyrin repeat protein